MKSVLGLLRADYGLDPERGGMARALARHVESRLAVLGLDEDGYVARVCSEAAERERLIHAATVRHSWFYRDAGQIDAIGEFLRTRHAEHPNRHLEVWVAGCAAGEEPWTLAMVAADLGVPVRVLATDVDTLAVADARVGCYGAWSLRELPAPLRRYLVPAGEGKWRIDDPLRGRVEFATGNLCDEPPRGRFDLICCRNVLIYFDPARARAVVARLRDSLRPDAQLVLGAGDLMFRVDAGRRVLATPIGTDSAPGVVPRPVDRKAKAKATKPDAKVELSEPKRSESPARSASGDAASLSVWAGREGEREGALERASAAVEAGQNDEALELLVLLVRDDPLLAEAHLWAGIAHHGLGDDRAAGEALRRARCLAPELWPATLFAALSNERRGLWQPAKRCWADLERIIDMPGAPAIQGTATLMTALPRWRGEASALARQRNAMQGAGPDGELVSPKGS